MLSTSNIICLLLTILCIPNVKNQVNLYNTDRSRNSILYHDCLLYFVRDTFPNTYLELAYIYRADTQIMPYCIRPVINELINDEFVDNSFTSFKFHELKRMNVSVWNLLTWSISIDLAEDYQSYLDTNSLILAEQVFKNCSHEWFGSNCQYTIFPYRNFHKFVDFLFQDKDHPFYTQILSLESITRTCYTYLNCSSCIDWREICDGKIDCPINGADEQNCLDLEMNECKESEYRCQNGLCVSESLLNDYPYTADCLDRSDEQEREGKIERYKMYANCYQDPGFRCEESYSINRKRNFHCGDGESITLFKEQCHNHHDTMHLYTLYAYNKNRALSYSCWLMLFCTLNFNRVKVNECNQFCVGFQCIYNLRNNCDASFVFFPQEPILHNHVRFAYLTDKIVYKNYYQESLLPDYVCYDNRTCPFWTPTLYVNGSACVLTIELKIKSIFDIEHLFRICLIEHQELQQANRHFEGLFQCPETTKFISKHRILDGISDCFDNIDEKYIDGCTFNHKHRFKCYSQSKCIARAAVYDGVKDCKENEDEIYIEKKLFPFHLYCNGFLDDQRELIEGQYETDETHCEEWPCDNMYTRCDRAWSCLNGVDELKCRRNVCPFDSFPCISPYNLSIICLPISRANDSIVDCLGASDERAYCRVLGHGNRPYKCWNTSTCVSIVDLCHEAACPFDNSESVCQNPSISKLLEEMEYDIDTLTHLGSQGFFIPDRSVYQHRINSNKYSLLHKHTVRKERIEHKMFEVDSWEKMGRWRCNRGVPVKTTSKLGFQCFCPPSYYGHHCQYQSQRISLTLTLRKVCAPKCFGVFRILVIVFDNEHVIHSQEQIIYLSTRHCRKKIHTYLLYNKRPKDSNKNYTIQIDVYNIMDMSYYASWIFPVLFTFLPVNRMSILLTVPSAPVTLRCSKYCGHGKCVSYINAEKEFCHCDSGWSGDYCLLALNCSCSSDSLCVGIIHKQSICLCPLHQAGLRCLLSSACQAAPCADKGHICIPDYRNDIEVRKCECQPQFLYDRCDKNTKFEISFSNVIIPQVLLIHLIDAAQDIDVDRSTFFSKIRLDQEEAITYLPHQISYLIFFQILNEYFLFVLPPELVQSSIVKMRLNPSRKCPHIRELIDTRGSSFPLLRRVKHYYTICQQHLDLRCFHDAETFMCLCTPERHANCFHFDFNMTYDCQDLNACQNNGQCFSNGEVCPEWVVCACPECFYGSKCQFTTKGFILSLDTIVGYSIRPRASFSQQLTPIKVSTAITISMFCIGLINSILSIMVFRMKSLKEIGCKYYLLALSINSLLAIVFFALKFIFLLLTQMATVTNRTFLYINCMFMDFFLQSLIAINDWLNACISIERTVTVIKGINFNKKKSSRIARFVLSFLVIIIFGSVVHDPIHRQIAEDEEEQRIWCIVQYRSFYLEILNSIIHILHFILPFSINIFSALTIIIIAARKRAAAQKQLSYKQHLREQCHHHNHLIISSIVLLLLGIPRLIISFFSGCMKSTRDSWLFLIGYFISYMPPLFTFTIYVLPSKTYRKEFNKLVSHYRAIV